MTCTTRSLKSNSSPLAYSLVLLSLPALGAPAEPAYVTATTLNVRAQASPSAEIVARWRINQPVTREGSSSGRWCEVTVPGKAGKGFVGCEFLARAPVSLAQVELETADIVLELGRLVLKYDGRVTETSWSATLEKNPAELTRLLALLFSQMERHFALSPSLRTYADFQQLLAVQGRLRQGDKPLPAPLESLFSSRAELLPAMRRALSANFSTASFAVVRRPILTSLSEILEKRQSSRRKATAASNEATRKSFFQGERWALGWAGGPLVHRAKSSLGQGVAYRFNFDGNGIAAIADVIEMAKAHKTAVTTTFTRTASAGDLSQMRAGWDARYEYASIATTLPAWAVTERGLVAGQLRKVSFGGDSCSEHPDHTAAEFVFPEPLKGTIHGVFVSSVAINPAAARVQVRKRTWLDPLFSDETTFSHAIRAEIDIDGDGIPDLRTVIKEDHSVSTLGGPRRVAYRPYSWPGGRTIRVGGWYANDIFQLEVNEEGRWRSLSLYNVVTCT